jgi:hypothetical protein
MSYAPQCPDGYAWRPGSSAGVWVLYRVKTQVMLAYTWPGERRYHALYNRGSITSERWERLDGDSLEHVARLIVTALVEAELERGS